MENNSTILLKNVNTNNLKNLNLEVPLNKLTVVTGVSGSGKSSLVFDTLYGESYRRYVDSLSSFARQYLKTLPRPDVESIDGLPSAIAVQQSRSGAGNRSTVGTLSELNDLVRLIFTHGSTAHCPSGHGPVVKFDPVLTSEDIFCCRLGRQITIAAPLSNYKSLVPAQLRSQLLEQGYVRFIHKGKVERIDQTDETDIFDKMVVIDRLTIEDNNRARLMDAIKSSFKIGLGELFVLSEGEERKYSSRMTCEVCSLKVTPPSAAIFNWNHPVGACGNCQGYGMESVIDWEKVFPDQDTSVSKQGIKPLNFGKHVKFYSDIKKNGEGLIDFNKPFSEYTAEEWQWIKFGDDSLRKGKRKRFEAVNGYFKWLDTKKYKAHYRMHAARFRKYVTCSVCEGHRLKKDAYYCYIGGLNIADVSELSIDKLLDWLNSITAENKNVAKKSTGEGSAKNPAKSPAKKSHGLLGVVDACNESVQRCSYLIKMGLGYLSLSRSSKTLSGGELQRINMARCLGSALTDTMFCLDEPTTGLHARDSEKLLSVLYELRDLGNTVVVVEHDPLIIRGADHVIEIGPGSGHEGGYVVFEGPASKTPILDSEKEHVSLGAKSSGDYSDFLTLKGVKTHNLKGGDLRLPLGAIIGVCGVSGSGKTSLIQHTLYPALCKALQQKQDYPSSGTNYESFEPSSLGRDIYQVEIVSQGALGRSTRSTIATYLGLMNGIRSAFASTNAAKSSGLSLGHFSFNVKGGRCETCRGLGTVIEDLSFLGDMAVNCPDCNGRRFGSEVLAVNFKGKNLNDVLSLTVAQARIFFHGDLKLTKILDHVIDMGLGYITLGQHTSSFSGGEAQRLKLLTMLSDSTKAFSQKPSILIFDEPTTGLSEKDVGVLMAQFRKLRENKHTVVIVEHHLGLLRSVDWLVEVGPESGGLGGQIVFQGPVEALRKRRQSAGSVTSKYLFS